MKNTILGSDNMKSQKLLESFTKYCNKHPEERFWQALRNWGAFGYILAATTWSYEKGHGFYDDIVDTFYWENKETR